MGRKIHENVFSTKVMSATTAAYFAGFMDGEGTISMTRQLRPERRAGVRYYPLCEVAQCDVSVLRWLRDECGNGRITQASRTGHVHRPLFKLQFSPHQIRHVLPQLMPHLRVKLPQAKLLMRFLEMTLDWHKHQRPVDWKEVETLRCDLQNMNPRGFRPDRKPIAIPIRESRLGNNQYIKRPESASSPVATVPAALGERDEKD